AKSKARKSTNRKISASASGSGSGTTSNSTSRSGSARPSGNDIGIGSSSSSNSSSNNGSGEKHKHEHNKVLMYPFDIHKDYKWVHTRYVFEKTIFRADHVNEQYLPYSLQPRLLPLPSAPNRRRIRRSWHPTLVSSPTHHYVYRIGGGHSSAGLFGEASDRCEVFNLIDLTWTALPRMRYARATCGAVLLPPDIPKLFTDATKDLQALPGGGGVLGSMSNPSTPPNKSLKYPPKMPLPPFKPLDGAPLPTLPNQAPLPNAAPIPISAPAPAPAPAPLPTGVAPLPILTSAAPPPDSMSIVDGGALNNSSPFGFSQPTTTPRTVEDLFRARMIDESEDESEKLGLKY
ncbi:hypothetical protein RFI_33469, partial [Reticulomyxa filosa]